MSETIFFDLETGGVEPRHPNIQLAAIAVEDCNWQEVSAFECKIKFNEADADTEALKLNHYDREAWSDSIPPAVAAQRFAKWLDPHRSIEMISKRTGAPYSVAKLAGYNALTFDLPRLRQMFGAMFFPCSYHVRDVLQRAMFYFDEHPEVKKPESLKLSIVCQWFGIESGGAHDALADVRLTAELLKRIRNGEK